MSPSSADPQPLAELEHLVLLAILQCREQAYGVSILHQLDLSGRSGTTRAAVYVVLKRLQSRGLLDSELGEPSEQRGGRAKRFYRLTAIGLETLRAQHHRIELLSRGLEEVLQP